MSLPVFARLMKNFDVAKLQQDLDVATKRFQTASQQGPYHDGAWRGIALRNYDGDHRNTSALYQGPGRDTEVMAHCPYIKSLIDQLGFRVNIARLLFLPPDKKIGLHRDDGLALNKGRIRLHIPIVTHEKVIFNLNGQRMQWRAGEFWFGDFSQPHSLHNQSDIVRVHLVLDATINQQLLDLFEPKAQQQLNDEVFIYPDAYQQPIAPQVYQQLSGYFKLTNEFMGIELSLIGHIERQDDTLALKLLGFNAINYQFVPISQNQFFMQGFVIEALEDSSQRQARVINKERKLDMTVKIFDKLSFGQKIHVSLQQGLGAILSGYQRLSMGWSRLSKKYFVDTQI